MRRFIDKTGRPGPATWEWETFSAGQGRCPVGGVSWHEAAAYAEFVGKDLCVVSAWEYAADRDMGTMLADHGNFGGTPVSVGQHKVAGENRGRRRAHWSFVFTGEAGPEGTRGDTRG